METISQSGDTTALYDNSNEDEEVEKVLDMIQKQGGKKVFDLLVAVSDTNITKRRSKNTDEEISNLQRKVNEFKLIATASVQDQELRKAPARCELVNRDSENGESDKPKRRSNILTSSGNVSSLQSDSKTDELNDLVNLSASMRRELQYRDEVLGLTSLHQPKRCRSLYNLELMKLRDKNQQVEKLCTELKKNNDELRLQLAFRDLALKKSEDTWELLSTKLAEPHHARMAINLLKKRRTFLKLSDLESEPGIKDEATLEDLESDPGIKDEATLECLSGSSTLSSTSINHQPESLLRDDVAEVTDLSEDVHSNLH